MVIVTSYVNPDLDGVGAAVAYAEFLRQQGIEAVAAFSGTPFVEVGWVMEKFKIPAPKNFSEVVTMNDEIVIVDTCGVADLDPKLQFEKVIEIIDHHDRGEADILFPKAKLQIEPIGAAASLVAERLHEAKNNPSRKAAILLLGGIISNTINFCSLNTSPRDEAMRYWLEPIANLPNTFIRDMFRAKTDLILADLPAAICSDGMTVKLAGIPVSQLQLEMIGIENCVREHYDDMKKTVQAYMNSDGARYALLNLIDLEAKTTDILTFDTESETMYSKALGIPFTHGRAHIQGILFRKQMIPLIRSHLGSIS